MIKAIETEYKRYRFRSRLEARWAVFFDTLGIKWLYEPEGFECIAPPEFHADLDLFSNPEVIRYLPDFFLPDSKTWVEVKGEWTKKDALDTANILSAEVLWHFDYYRDFCNRDGYTPGLLLLGNIPDIDYGYVEHPLVVKSKNALWLESVVLTPTDVRRSRWCIGDEWYASETGSEAALRMFSTKNVLHNDACICQQTLDAYNAAKSARFEFGQCGALK